MPALIFLGGIIWAVGLYILYLIVRTAVNSSDVAKMLTEIRDILKKQELERKAVNIPESEIRDSTE